MIELLEDLLHHFGRKLLVVRQQALFEEFGEFGIGEIPPVEGVFLAEAIIGGIEEVLGLEAGSVQRYPTRVSLVDKMLFNQIYLVRHWSRWTLLHAV
jgi:hypothetical protein